MADPRIAELQRELLAVCKGGHVYATWAKVNGVPLNERFDWRGNFGKLRRANEIRAKIIAIDPNAALYYGWAGPGDEPPGDQQRLIP